jgi:hypothetical protein
LFNSVFQSQGIPPSVVSGHDPRFVSDFWQEGHKGFGTQRCMSTFRHPQTDGQSVNGVLEDTRRHFVGPYHQKWDQLLPAAEFARQDAYHKPWTTRRSC